ncbi:SGNH/GDSL hydrolase family protein [Pendulispora rubella]|uniref:SGNH/GDSL hydrolase family protein n=1 Tax=Pendulispora rubella TaxID=2741070 RepID=A0ABZ2L1W7_9BACT
MRRIRTGSTWSPRSAAVFIALFVGGAFAACSSSSSDGDPTPDAATPRDTSTPKQDTGTDAQDSATDAKVQDAPSDGPRADAADGSITDAGKDTSTTDSGLPPAASLWAGPALPAFDMATVTHVRQVRATGQTKSNRLAVVAKFGDSITAQAGFFYDVGDGNTVFGSYTALQGTIDAIRAVTVGDGKNSFNRVSTGATGGWKSGDVLSPTNHVEGEVSALRPGYAIVMFGTNDGNATTFATNMNTIVDQLEAEGVVAIVSTIPDRTDYDGAEQVVRAMSEKVRTMAAQRHLPMIDLFAGLSTLPSSGLGPDEIHPSMGASGTTANFTADYITVYGYNVRNLTAIQMLDRLRALPQ